MRPWHILVLVFDLRREGGIGVVSLRLGIGVLPWFLLLADDCGVSKYPVDADEQEHLGFDEGIIEYLCFGESDAVEVVNKTVQDTEMEQRLLCPDQRRTLPVKGYV